MESYLVDICKLRIPRPKFATSSSSQQGRCYGPHEPPRDYNMDDDFIHGKNQRTRKLHSEAEDVRQAIQEKL